MERHKRRLRRRPWRHQRPDEAPQTDRFGAEIASQKRCSPSRHVAFVEDEIDHLEHGRQTLGHFIAAGHLERHARFRKRALGPHDTLCDRRFRHEKRSRDLIGRQAAEQAQRERGAGFARQHGMAGDEDQPEHVITDMIVERSIEIRHRGLL